MSCIFDWKGCTKCVKEYDESVNGNELIVIGTYDTKYLDIDNTICIDADILEWKAKILREKNLKED